MLWPNKMFTSGFSLYTLSGSWRPDISSRNRWLSFTLRQHRRGHYYLIPNWISLIAYWTIPVRNTITTFRVLKRYGYTWKEKKFYCSVRLIPLSWFHEKQLKRWNKRERESIYYGREGTTSRPNVERHTDTREHNTVHAWCRGCFKILQVLIWQLFDAPNLININWTAVS